MVHQDRETDTTDDDHCVDVKTTGKILGLSIDTLNAWRLHGKGPAFHRFGRLIRYRLGDIRAYQAKSKIGGRP